LLYVNRRRVKILRSRDPRKRTPSLPSSFVPGATLHALLAHLYRLELTYNTLIKHLYIIEKTAIFAVGGTIQWWRASRTRT